jgi:putative ABC transport system substrate-binding protein
MALVRMGINRQCGRQATKLLRGVKVADVPVEQPTELVLAISLKTPKALGVIIPPTLLSPRNPVMSAVCGRPDVMR